MAAYLIRGVISNLKVCQIHTKWDTFQTFEAYFISLWLSKARMTNLVQFSSRLYNQEQKKRTFFKIDFLTVIFIKIHHIIYQIKHNWMNFMMVKIVSKNILR